MTVSADDELDAFERAVSSALTNVSVAGVEATALCSGELVYVTFEQVCRG